MTLEEHSDLTKIQHTLERALRLLHSEQLSRFRSHHPTDDLNICIVEVQSLIKQTDTILRNSAADAARER